MNQPQDETSGPDVAPRRLAPCLMGIYFLSGACSLIDEVVWVRLLKLTLGNTVYASSIVVSVFMAGLAAGAMWMGRRADRVRRPLRLYAALEALAAASALALPWMLTGVDALYVRLCRTWQPSAAAMPVLQVAACAAVLLVPSFLMGTTLPLLGAWIAARSTRLGHRVGRLYALNVLGAAVGAFLARFVLIRALGVMGTLYVAAALNGLVAAAAALLSRYAAPAAPQRTTPAAPRPTRRRPPALLAAAFTAGLVGIGYELIWMRSIVHLLNAETYVFSAVLTVYLLGNMLGAGLGSRLAKRAAHPALGFAATLSALGILGVVYIPLLAAWSAAAGPGLNAWVDRHHLDWPNLVTLGYPLVQSLALFLLPSVVMGMGFPLALDAWGRHQHAAGRATGGLYALNTIGAVLGGLATGFFLIPLIGVQWSITLLGLAAAGAALSLALSIRPMPARAGLAVGMLALLALAVALATPGDLFRHSLIRYADAELIDVREGVTATVSVHRQANGDLWLCSSGLQIAGDRALSVQTLLGHLPVLLRPEARSALTVGFGSGQTTACLARHRLDRIDCVEISPEVVELSLKHFRHINLGDRLAERVNLTFMDAKNYLHLSRRRYDLIITDSINPKYFAENASLYTHEYFRSAAEHLNDGGLLVCWIPFTLPRRCFDSILGTFVEVFPHTTLWFPASKPDHFVLAVGSPAPQRFSLDRMRTELARTPVRRSLRRAGMHSVEDVLCCYLGDQTDIRRYLADYIVNSDDRPFVEFSTDSAQVGGAEWSFIIELIAAVRHRSIIGHVDPAGLPPAERDRLAERLERLRAAGSHLLTTQIVHHAARLYGPSETLAKAAGRLVAREAPLMESLSACLSNGGEYLTGYAVRGSLRLGDGDAAGAIADFDEVIRLDPENAIAFRSRATARYLLGRYAEAWADAERCRQLGLPLHPRLLADLRRRLGR